jgi:hypothetical protein
MTLKFEYSLIWSCKLGIDYESPTCECLYDLTALDYEVLIDVGKLRDAQLFFAIATNVFFLLQ